MAVDLRAGQTLPGVVGTVTQDTIDKYAVVSGDWNPLHVDPEFGRQTIFGSTIAHGPIAVDFAVQALCRYLGQPWLAGGVVRAKFIAPVRPGDQVTGLVKVKQVEAGSGAGQATFEFECQNQSGAAVVVGEIDAPL